jgi:SAM-dependent methyltransferase
MPEALASVGLDVGAGAPTCVAGPGRNPIELYFRHVVQERLRGLFAPGSRVLHLGCGTGEDSLFLASLGLDVFGIDVSPARIGQARIEADRRLSPRGSLRFEVGTVEHLEALDGVFDGAYSSLDVLDRATLPVLGEALRRRLRPGAPVALCARGARPFPGLAEKALTGRSTRSGEGRVGERSVPAPGLSWSDLREGLGNGFRWDASAALGVLVPAPSHGDWARRNPLVFGLLAAAERLVREWRLARDGGHHLVALGVRE